MLEPICKKNLEALLANEAAVPGHADPLALSLKHTLYWPSTKSAVAATCVTDKAAEPLGITDNVLMTAASVTGDPYLIVAF